MNPGRVVLITGAAGGVGNLLVERFAAEGDTVVATDTGQDALDARRAGWPSGATIVTTAADISSQPESEHLAQVVRQVSDHLDVLVNCAGFFPIVSFEEMTHDQWRRVIDINLTGTFLTTHALLPLLKRSGHGRIVNFSSASVFPGVAGQTHYVAAKAGIIGFTRSLAREVGGDGVTVNAITPGLTVTGSVRERFPAEVLAAQRERRALQRDETPEDLVGPVAFLASDDAAFITGQVLNVDGGTYMH